MGADNTDMYAPAAHYDRVHRAWELIMGEEFHYGCFASADTPLERATEALTGSMLDTFRFGSNDCSLRRTALIADPAAPRVVISKFKVWIESGLSNSDP